MSISVPAVVLINTETLAIFRDLLDPDEFKDFFLRAQQELERSRHQMEVHFAAREWEGLRATAHRLKGSLGSVGCDALFAKLDELEQQLCADPITEPGSLQMQDLSDTARATSGLLGQLSI